jgi:RHH-type proline utilization regulon transcriptional repressor/proline dehydrogenase/delta 1-pyrroline-5-carboxylate dehydrogenase
MSESDPDFGLRPADIAQEAVELARTWVQESPTAAVDPAAARLASVLKDPKGLEFTVAFVDGVARPQDTAVAARNLRRLSTNLPRFLPWYQRALLRIGGAVGPALPWLVVPAARGILRRMVGHLVIDATPEKLGSAIAKLREPGNQHGHGARLNLNLLGEAVLGEKEAQRHLDGTLALLERDDVDYVSVKVSAIASQLNLWSFDETVNRIVERLVPLYEHAATFTGFPGSGGPRTKFINLDMEEYRDLSLTVAVFEKLLNRPSLLELEAGIVLQAYLPDALDALQGLTEWAQDRRASGGAPIKVRLVKGANLAMERVDAAIHGWALAPYSSKMLTDANYKRVLDWALTPEHTAAVKLGVAGHNLFDIAYAWVLASRRGVTDRMDVEMLLGLASSQAEAVTRTVGQLLLYTPVVRPAEFDVAISYLIRRLEENASAENFMSSAFSLADDKQAFDREKERFLTSIVELEYDDSAHGLAPLPNRTQDRGHEWQPGNTGVIFKPRAALVDPAAVAEGEGEGLTSAVLGLQRGSSGLGASSMGAPSAGAGPEGEGARGAAPAPLAMDVLGVFRNEADTDPALPANRAWGSRILSQVPSSELGVVTLATAGIDSMAELDSLIELVRASGAAWGNQTGFDRAAVLDRAGIALAANRDRLIEVMAAETGKTIAEGDPEVSEAVDFAHYYAARARELDTVQGAVFVPSKLTVVTPPWNFPVSIPAGSVLAALAAGSGVIIKPAPQAKRSAAVMVEALWEAGIPRELLALVELHDAAGDGSEVDGEGELGRALVSDRRVDRVILTGAYETAKLFTSWRQDLPLLAETSGKNAIIVTPSADYDLAVSDIVKSAFGHAGQKCSAASLVILVGSAARSERFKNQLIDAVTSLVVGYPGDPATVMGPIIEPAQGKLLHALTTLGGGENWLIAPRQLDGSGRLWSPGIRTGVQPGSYFHLTEFFGPVLGIMHARDLGEAIRLQNAVDYGLTAGLHSLDADEIAVWLEEVEAGNLYVNRGITGAIVQRQPFGGWKRSSVGAGTKAGGPNYLFGLGDWVPDTARGSSSLHLRGLDEKITELIESGQSSMDYEAFDRVRGAALSDAIAAATAFDQTLDVSGLGVERNLLRYRPVPVSVRLAQDGGFPDLLRVLAAATMSGSDFDLSTSTQLPDTLREVLRENGVRVAIESDNEWLTRVARSGLSMRPDERTISRVRLIAGSAAPVQELIAALGGSPDVAIHAGAVTPSGRVELLPFLREQAISITNHRFGTPSHLTDAVV